MLKYKLKQSEKQIQKLSSLKQKRVTKLQEKQANAVNKHIPRPVESNKPVENANADSNQAFKTPTDFAKLAQIKTSVDHAFITPPNKTTYTRAAC